MIMAGPLNLLQMRSEVYQSLPSLSAPWWSIDWRVPQAVHTVIYVLVFLVTGTAGLVSLRAVRPQNRFAEVAAGLITGTTAAFVLFTLGAAWYFIMYMTWRPAGTDLKLLPQSAAARATAQSTGQPLSPDADPLLQAYPDLRSFPEPRQTELLIMKFYSDCYARVPLAILAALAASLIVSQGVCLSGVLAASRAVRLYGWSRRTLVSFASLAIPAAFLCGLVFERILLVATGRSPYHLLAMDLAVMGSMACAILAQLRSWPRTAVGVLQLVWVIGLMLRLTVFAA